MERPDRATGLTGRCISDRDPLWSVCRRGSGDRVVGGVDDADFVRANVSHVSRIVIWADGQVDRTRASRHGRGNSVGACG